MPIVLLLLLLFLAPSSVLADDATQPPVREDDILPYLEQVIAWQRAIGNAEQLPDNAREVVLKDRMHLNAKTVLGKSFAFARAEVSILESAPATTTANAPETKETESRRSRLMKAAAEADQRVTDLQNQLAQASLTDALREKLKGDLKLAQARQDLLKTMLGIFVNEDEDSGALIDQINALARTANVPVDQPPPASGASSAKESATTAPKERDITQDDGGMLRLSGMLLSLSRKKDSVNGLHDQTHKLREATHNLILSIRNELKAALTEGNNLSASATNPASYRQSVDDLVRRYKQLSAVIIPLGEMTVLLEGEERSLEEWGQLITEDWARVLHRLLIRVAVLSVSLAIPLILSALGHRAIHRYIGDGRRQKQLDMARRVVLIIVLAFVILANFLTEFGSLATFAGFMTAGLAVALQTVLVSLVAHFLYFGRYGIRYGDRITVGDVTGEVLQVGLLRLYLRELKPDDHGKLAPTGKIVAFPNSILFQPTAFYKYVDGR